ncbi:sensor of ECF-type sigma factor [Flavobacterium cyanobacteriorum]|uniref:Sensor of ECF-type sigma factor n=1 Tax=Flavobacterium cyanobacteriorum TaxID=2022802 RepID=A0A255ZIZ8_9FLAO|nr:sensor of ECF-type sigma factor [Flavobacterium cyanobacteriorum]OYQ41527.1 sensor of ECF-type sigma factor [Flavobacterium cyanobacteriorum]
MKIKILLPLLCLLSITATAQDGKEKREQVKALKVSFFTLQLNLTSDEAAKFWPVYNAYEEKVYSLRHNRLRPLIKSIDQTGVDKVSEKEALAYVDQIQDIEREIFNARQKLVTDLKPIIGPIKLLKLKKAEDDFNKKLLSKYKERRN